VQAPLSSAFPSVKRFLENKMEINKIRKPSKKLNELDAAKIKRLLNEGHFQNRIAAMFDVNPGRISEIKKERKFAYVPEQLTLFESEIGSGSQ
jgi:hypothetical protein